MISPKELAENPRDTKTEKKLASELRLLSEKERWNYLQEALNLEKNSNNPNSLILAARVKLGKDSQIKILDIGMEVANPSSMHAYLNAVINGLGYRRVVEYFEEQVETQPEKVAMALYFLPNLNPKPNEEQINLIKGLKISLVNHVNKLEIRSEYLESVLVKYA